MKISCNFDSTQRSFILTPEDELEVFILKEMSDRAARGQRITLSAIGHEPFAIQVKVNGDEK
jgi:hypothetical protein